jgi:hypothetical protein
MYWFSMAVSPLSVVCACDCVANSRNAISMKVFSPGWCGRYAALCNAIVVVFVCVKLAPLPITVKV